MLTNLLVGLVFAVIVGVAARKAYKDAKKGACSCGSCSSSCPSKGACGK